MKRPIIILIIVGVLAVAAFFTNPDQASHIRTIKETIKLRNPSALSILDSTPVIEYKNYFVFSTTTFGGMTFSHGYFGRVTTTNDIRFFEGMPLPK